MGTSYRVDEDKGRHIHSQYVVTIAIMIVVMADYIATYYFPGFEPFVPFTGFIANIMWIWSE